MENENSKINQEREAALKTKKYLPQKSKNIRKDDKTVSYMSSKSEKNEQNNISPRAIFAKMTKRYHI